MNRIVTGWQEPGFLEIEHIVYWTVLVERLIWGGR